jgi:hypothetical protein
MMRVGDAGDRLVNMTLLMTLLDSCATVALDNERFGALMLDQGGDVSRIIGVRRRVSTEA